MKVQIRADLVESSHVSFLGVVPTMEHFSAQSSQLWPSLRRKTHRSEEMMGRSDGGQCDPRKRQDPTRKGMETQKTKEEMYD